MKRRIVGLESEYGCVFRSPDGSFVQNVPRARINAYLIGRFARVRPQTDKHSPSISLANGGRLYQDVGEHIEIATPECLSVRDVVRYIRAGDRFLEENFSVSLQKDEFGGVTPIFIRDNTDAVDSGSFAAHENYLAERIDHGNLRTLLGEAQRNPRSHAAKRVGFLAAHLATRIIYTGCGVTVGNSAPEALRVVGSFALSSRARWIEHLAHDQPTHLARPIFSMRDRSYCSVLYQRIHLTCGDPNISDVAEYLKFGTTSLVLRVIEEVEPQELSIAFRNPVAAMRGVNGDLTFRKTFSMLDGTQWSALDVQEAILEIVDRYFPRDDDPDEVAAETRDIKERWGKVLAALRRDPMELCYVLDWPTKKAIVDRILQDRFGIEDRKEIPKIYASDFDRGETIVSVAKLLEARYHAVGPWGLRSVLFPEGSPGRIVTDAEIADAVLNPPGSHDVRFRTRAWGRTKMSNLLWEHRIPHIVGWHEIRPPGTYETTAVWKVSFLDPFSWTLPLQNLPKVLLERIEAEKNS